MTATIPQDARSAMEGALPSALSTCNPDGTPNVTIVSQCWYVDERHVALSFQFFNKTIKNVRQNPVADVVLTCPNSFAQWSLRIRYLRSETEGPVFEDMDAALEVIASMHGMTGIFKLQAADIYEVLDVQRVPVFEPMP